MTMTSREQVIFTMALGNVEHVHERCPQHMRMETARIIIIKIIIIIYHDFLPTPRRGSHVKSGKTHTQSSRYTP